MREIVGKFIRARLAPLYILVSILSASSCSSIDCPVDNLVFTVYDVYSSTTNAPDTLHDTLAVTTTRRDLTDSVLLNRLVNATTFDLPISYTAPEDTLVFWVWDSLSISIDTVYVAKENYAHFESVDCNLSYFHNITGVRWTTNGIDSVVINRQSVNYDYTTEHFHIYFKGSR